MLSEKGSRVIALRGRTSGRALYCGRKVSSLVVRDAGGAIRWLSSATRVTPQDDRMSLGLCPPACWPAVRGRQRSRSAPYFGVARNYGGLLGGGSLMKPSACGLRLAVVNDVWDNGVTDVTVGVIAQGVIMLHHACVRVPCDGTMLMPSGPYAPRPRLPSITVGSQALQSTLSKQTVCSR